MWSLRKEVLRLIDIILECCGTLVLMQQNIEIVNNYAGTLEERIERLENRAGLNGRKLAVKTNKKK